MIVSKFRSSRLRLKMYGFVVWQTRTWNEAQIIAVLLEISARQIFIWCMKGSFMEREETRFGKNESFATYKWSLCEQK